ncbi:uncharacterized protein LTR77_007239 [Saxophila tyrrhenica]|uniref:CoA-transferase family III n=1 Tax=Saxophila tyrrhenica TaxID=1690608 RepID=A0AAV9P841_9PEZI|nr:hypothetical protein LTR77_007239 [Saxophila tyrrhenica]
MKKGTINGVSRHAPYFVPDEAIKVFHNHILSDQRISKDLPSDIQEAAAKVHFTGSPSPSLPINWRFAEAVSSLKALEASLVNVLVKRKYHTQLSDVTIDTDHATLFIMSGSLWSIDPGEGGLNITAVNLRKPPPELEQFFPNCDIHRSHATLHRSLATGIYPTSDDRYFNIHGDMNPDPCLDALDLPHDMDHPSFEAGVQCFQNAVGRLSSSDLEHRFSDLHHQSGTTCLSRSEFNASAHGKANAHVGLWELHPHPNPSQPPCWWPSIPSTSPARPLAGLKVVDLTRVIAAPAVTRGLAELGASVMRVTAPHLPDVSGLHPDLNWGKWNTHLDLRNQSDREKLRVLILDADVVVQAYRPSALAKYGFSEQDILSLCSTRSRGIISVRENCYGWHGPWSHRSGWQQISDAVCGCDVGFGEAMGLENGEAVQPIYPHSDYCTGISGTCAILIALMRRAEEGGSFAVDLALNYYTTWLVNSVAEYPKEVWEKVWAEHGRKVWRSWDANTTTGPATMKSLRAGEGGKRLFKEEFFGKRKAPGILGEKVFRHIKPVAQSPAGTVEPGFRIGTRGNGVDAPHWPKDLSAEVVG